MSGIAGLVATSNIVPRLVRGLQQLFMREVLRLPCNVMHRFIGAKVRNRGGWSSEKSALLPGGTAPNSLRTGNVLEIYPHKDGVSHHLHA